MQYFMKIIQKGLSLKQIAANIRNRMATTIPQNMRTMTLEHFDNSFRNQGFTDNGFQPWKPRKAEKRVVFLGSRKRASRKNADANRAILIKSGRLRRSIKARFSGKSILFTSDVEYAQIHNEGGRAGRKLSAQIPRRRFAGRSAMLEAEIKRMISRELNSATR
jgi:phage gpG-like protein